MSEDSEEDFEILSNLSVNIDLDAFEALSTVSSAPSQICEFGRSQIFSFQNAHIVSQIAQRQLGTSSHKTHTVNQPLRSFYLKKILPPSILQNQIFMGMTRCGRYLMTYSATLLPEEEEWYGCVYRYQLHWWLTAPETQAREIGSVVLFGSFKVIAPLQVYICQWPKYNDKVLVYGLMKENGGVDADGAPVNQRAYVTVAATPDNSCTDCQEKHQSSILLGVSEKNVRCMKHSFAVHTSFDIAVPYPEFLPRILLKFDDFAVFNTNNVLHALRISLENEQQDIPMEAERDLMLSVQVPPSPVLSVQSHLQEQIIRDFADDGSLTPRQGEDSPSSKCELSIHDYLGCMSPPLPTRLKTFPESSPSPSKEGVHEFITPKVVFKVKKIGAKRLGFRPFFSARTGTIGVFHDSHPRKLSPYEFVDDSQGEVEQLSQFRRKLLAEKTYEFQESDSENILPFSMARLGPGRSLSQFHVLRPLNRNTVELRAHRSKNRCYEQKISGIDYDAPRRRIEPDEVVVGDLSGRYKPVGQEEEEKLSAGLRRLRHCFRGTAARFIRRYIDADSLSNTLTSEMDDDEHAASGYHTRLNMEAQIGNQALHVRRGNVTEPGLNVRVEQQSLDIEVICQSVATSLCIVAQKTFTFCNDYDVEVIDVCPRSGDVLVLLMMRIEGCEGKKEEGSIIEQFEASVTLLWNLSQGDYRIVMVVPPQKMKWAWSEKSVWNPAREASRSIRINLPFDVTRTDPAVRLCTNASVLRGMSLNRIHDFDNGIQFLM